MASHSLSRDRYSFANLGEALEIPDLIAVQRESFEWFVRQALSLPNQAISIFEDSSMPNWKEEDCPKDDNPTMTSPT